ncbi:hypothetical protein RIF29_21267 [Crotalaria pallida]|uniref:Uncharacterized protein n=1 Tax=Crotalaria pallida TaxID=3830 RepID=A0AAN9F485_CROPI
MRIERHNVPVETLDPLKDFYTSMLLISNVQTNRRLSFYQKLSQVLNSLFHGTIHTLSLSTFFLLLSSQT